MTAPTERRLLISLVSSAPSHAGKALRMGRKFLAAGWGVTLLVSVGGTALLDPERGRTPCPVEGMPLADLLARFLADGGAALVGGECLRQAGLEPGSLPAGVAVAAFPAVEELLSAPDLRIMTW